MADNPRLQVEIGADIRDINLALATLEKSLENLQRDAGDTKGLDKLSKTLDQLGDESTVVKNELINTGKTTRELSSGFGDAGKRAQELVGGLSDVAAGADGAVGSIGTLIGAFAAGGGLASVATAALELIVDNWDKVLRAVGNVNQLLLDQAAIYTSLAGVNREQIDLVGDQVELARLQGASVEEIRALQAEQVAAIGDALTTERQRLAVQTQIADKATKELQTVQKIRDAFAAAGPNTTREEILQSLGDEISEFDILKAQTADIIALNETANAERQKALELERGVVGLQTELQSIGNQNVEELKKQADEAAKLAAALEKAAAADAARLLKSQTAVGAGLRPGEQKVATPGIPSTPLGGLVPIGGLPGIGDITDTLVTDVEEVGPALSAAFIDTAAIATQGITALATGIGLALANGSEGIKQAGQLVLSAIGDILTQVGQALIAAGAVDLAKALFGIIAAPGVSIAAGAALVALGTALGSVSSGSPGGSTGGAAGVGSSGGSFNPASARTPSIASAGQQTYVFEIAGTKLIGVINNTLEQNNRLNSPFLK